MTRITLKIQQPTGQVERRIDRASGAPAVDAAVCCDTGTEKIGHVDYACLLAGTPYRLQAVRGDRAEVKRC